MTSPAPLAPATRATRCRDSRRFPLSFAFGPRFFVALLAGAVFLGPAWWDHRFILAMFAWDALMLIVWMADCRRLPDPGDIEAAREWPDAISLDAESVVWLRVVNRSSVVFRGELIDSTPAAWRGDPPRLHFRLAPGEESAEGYRVRPRQRGDTALGLVYVNATSALQFAERWMTADLSQSTRVYPNLRDARRLTLYLVRSQQVQMERRLKIQRGRGREFESLREYRSGDEKRDICWTATARRARLVTKTYEHERSQSVIVVVDAGRLMLARAGEEDWTKLDYAASAALALSQVALRSGDRVGLVTYARSIQTRIKAGRGPAQVRGVYDALATVRGELSEAAHDKAGDAVLRMQPQRGLVLWLTDLAETAAVPEVIDVVTRVASRHLVLFVAIGQPQLDAVIQTQPSGMKEMYRYTAAMEMVDRRETLLRRLRQAGVLVLDLDPQAVAAEMVNEYLRVKERGLL